ncbi:hypothetical protein ACFFSY_21470 [Paenibacillus aurantiacus]|uniref:Uncharacterized protein n=1 Tax=Paenibacillus aurantiacus TaxID=1936118 RepID=A0ABV5KVA0_9BACL
MYHWWIYEYVVNTSWFVRGFTWLLFLINFALPVIVWFTMSSRNPFRRDENAAGASSGSTEEQGEPGSADKNAKNPPGGGS